VYFWGVSRFFLVAQPLWKDRCPTHIGDAAHSESRLFWSRSSWVLWVSLAEYSLFYRALLQKRPIFLRSLLISPRYAPRKDIFFQNKVICFVLFLWGSTPHPTLYLYWRDSLICLLEHCVSCVNQMCAHVVSCSSLRRSQDSFSRPEIKRFFRKQIFSKEISVNLEFGSFSELLVPDSNENNCATIFWISLRWPIQI